MTKRCGICEKFLSSRPYPRSRQLPGSVVKRHMEEAHGWKKNKDHGTEYGMAREENR